MECSVGRGILQSCLHLEMQNLQKGCRCMQCKDAILMLASHGFVRGRSRPPHHVGISVQPGWPHRQEWRENIKDALLKDARRQILLSKHTQSLTRARILISCPICIKTLGIIPGRAQALVPFPDCSVSDLHMAYWSQKPTQVIACRSHYTDPVHAFHMT